MTATSDRSTYIRQAGRHHLSPAGWTAYAPLGRPHGPYQRARRRWQRSLPWRILTLPYAVREAGRAYDKEKPW